MTAARKLDTSAIDYRARLGISWEPSSYQIAIWDHVRIGRGHAVVNAVAGSGKSTTIVQAAKLISGEGLFLAFNKSIADELGAKLKGTSMRASTIHAHGNAAVRDACGRVRVESRKYWDMVRLIEREAKGGTLFGAALPQRAARMLTDKPRSFPGKEIIRLIDLARLSLVNCELPEGDFATEVGDIAARQGVQWDYAFDGVVERCVQRMMQAGMRDTNVIDFTDMVWLPCVHGYQPKRYAWILVDECQDLSPAALELIKRSVARGGRCIFVGDPKQAIYSFAGADTEAFSKIVDFCGGVSLPLSVCYRCPSSAIELAKEFCPQIEARPGAPEGAVRDIMEDTLGDEVREGDMILCRQTAPLVSTCLMLIGKGLPARVKGKDIGEGIVRVAKEAAELGGGFDRLAVGLSSWYTAQYDRLVRKHGDNEDAIKDGADRLADQVSCVEVIADRSQASTEDEFVSAVSEIFDDSRASVQLSTVHRAKGLESERVFIVRPELLESPRARTPQQMEQEQNLFYVALTRCKSELVFVREGREE